MGYSTYMEDRTLVADSYDIMGFEIERALRNKKPVYVLSMSREDFNSEDYIKQLREIEGVHYVLPVNGTVDVIVAGHKEEVKNVARKVYEQTGQNIGCVEYNGEDMLSFYITLKEAIDIAREKREPWHFYDPKEDSLEALVEKARSN